MGFVRSIILKVHNNVFSQHIITFIPDMKRHYFVNSPKYLFLRKRNADMSTVSSHSIAGHNDEEKMKGQKSASSKGYIMSVKR